jgi:RNA polymerase sigma-70 factor (ECF subfamily)
MSLNGAEIAAARPRVIGALAAQFRDLDLAEEAFGAAVEALLSSAAAPGNAAAWLYVTARRKALDQLRRRSAEARAQAALVPLEDEMAEIIALPDPIPDERLRLVFICCHPALAPEARVALTLKVVCGVETGAIARAFLVSEQAMFQRLTRARAKVAQAGVPFETPARRFWGERLTAVLATLEVAWSVAYRDAAGASETGSATAELAPEVERLALLLAEFLPQESEVLGLAASVLLARSREAARVDPAGAMVPLSEQDVALWDRAKIDQAHALLIRAQALGERGPHQTLAAIHLAHAMRLESGVTPWATIAALYDRLARLRPSAVVGINRAVAYGRAYGAERGVAELAELDGERLAGFLPWHVARADLLARAGQSEDAREAFLAALALDPGPAERRYLERRLAAHSGL